MIETTALPGGARLVCEHMAYARSVALGIWVAGGVYDEGERNAGVTHALEHMVFKGTPRRTAAAVAADTDAIGGQVNAFTAKDLTGFYARCLNTHFPRALDLLGDIFFNALLEESDWEKERDVIIDEISLAKDNPEELVCDELYSAVYAGKPLGRPVPGTVAALESLTAADIAAHRLRTRFGPRVVVSLCGAYTPADRQAAEERFSVLAPSGAYSYEPSAYSPRLTATEKDNEQNHFIAAFPALEAGHPDRFALDVMNSIVGAGVSSRLFRRLREEEGLCYSVCSSTATHPHAGFFGVYLATGPRMEERALRLMAEVLRDFARHGPLEEETERAREQIKANVLMSFESTMWCAQHHGQSELLIGKVPAPEEVMASFDAVTSETVRALARKVLDFSALSLSAVGRVSGKDYMSLLT